MGVKKSIPKIDGKGLVIGKPAYTDDLSPENVSSPPGGVRTGQLTRTSTSIPANASAAPT